uniref:DNA recombination protein RmuC n=1 Tax=Nitratifractor sp. TaxID=2268144 RepID=UPI0025F67946
MGIYLPEWIVWGAGGLTAGALIAGVTGAVLCRLQRKTCMEKEERLHHHLAAESEEKRSLQRLLEREKLQRVRAETALEQLAPMRQRLQKREEEIEGLQERMKASAAERSALESRLEEQERHYRQLTEELKEAREELQRQFRSLAGEIMEENALRFQSVSREGVAQILRPLQQQVERFRKRVDEVHSEESREMAALQTELKTLRELNRQISEEAHNLTRALKGEHKSQGIWGEMVLERILEASGLREGEEFERELSLRDGEARRFRPDVVVHLPGGRDVVIDAKTSLNAYERYIAAESEAERQIQARAHLQAVKAHIGELGDKNYANLEGIETLDFIFMFLPI